MSAEDGILDVNFGDVARWANRNGCFFQSLDDIGRVNRKRLEAGLKQMRITGKLGFSISDEELDRKFVPNSAVSRQPQNGLLPSTQIPVAAIDHKALPECKPKPSEKVLTPAIKPKKSQFNPRLPAPKVGDVIHEVALV